MIPPSKWPLIEQVLPDLRETEESAVEGAGDLSRFDQSIGRRVAKYRKREHMTLKELAEETGLPRRVIEKIEDGSRETRVHELMVLSTQLRVPMAALLFDVEAPFAPVEVFGEDSPVKQIFPSRTLDMIDGLTGQDADRFDDDLRDFDRDLQMNGPIVIPGIGVAVEASYGPSGERAINLIRAAKHLDRAIARRDAAHYELRLQANSIWPYREHQAQREQLEDAMRTGDLSESSITRALLDEVADGDLENVKQLIREADATANNALDARRQFEALGGDSRTHLGVLSRRELAEFARRMHVQRFRDHLMDIPVSPEDKKLEQARMAELARIDRTMALHREAEEKWPHGVD